MNSDSCSAVSSNSDEGRSSKSADGDNSSQQRNNFSSCSEDSDGTKQKIEKKARAFKEQHHKREDTQRTSSNAEKLGDRVSKKYKRFLMKAKKVLTAGKNQMVCWNFTSRDQIKYCYLKAIDYYKKALRHSRTSRDKGRIYVLIAQTQISLTPKLFERD